MERTVIRLNKGYKFKLFDSGETEQAVLPCADAWDLMFWCRISARTHEAKEM